MPPTDQTPAIHGSNSERIALLELDMKWVKHTTEGELKGFSNKLDQLLEVVGDVQINLKAEIKQDLHSEFDERFVPKKALWIAMGVSGGFGLVAGAAFQPLVLKLMALMV